MVLQVYGIIPQGYQGVVTWKPHATACFWLDCGLLMLYVAHPILSYRKPSGDIFSLCRSSKQIYITLHTRDCSKILSCSFFGAWHQGDSMAKMQSSRHADFLGTGFLYIWNIHQKFYVEEPVHHLVQLASQFYHNATGLFNLQAFLLSICFTSSFHQLPSVCDY